MLNIWKFCLGKNNGLGRKLSEYVERDIIEHHCLAHCLHLAIRRAFTISEKYDRQSTIEIYESSRNSFEQAIQASPCSHKNGKWFISVC